MTVFFKEIADEINKAETETSANLGNWMKFHVWDQLTNAIIRGLPTIDVGPVHIGRPPQQPTNKQGGTG